MNYTLGVNNIDINDLKKDKYYCCHREYSPNIYYFKYDYHDNHDIYCHGFEIRGSSNHFNYYEIPTRVFSYIEWILVCSRVYEVDIKTILHYLPDDNSDKKIYLRKNKIEYLISLTK